MKIIKKIAAIMLSVMMVLGMCSVVGAAETSGTSADYKGKITIDNAIVGQTYTIYQILELESFSDKTTEPNTGNYAYKPTSTWEQFVSDAKNESGVKYFIKDGEYVKWNPEVGTDATVIAKFAKEALEYAGKSNINFTQQQKNVTNTTVEFKDLSLGYYLVDSSTGALCSLDTTAKEVTIKEKNGVPSVEKKVQEDSKIDTTDEYGESNTADIGQTVNFQTTITAQPGAQNYVLHDKMSEGLTFDKIDSVKVGNTTLVANTDYVTERESTGDECTFHITFTPTYCESIKTETIITVTYSATLNENATIAGDGNKNETWLKYGESSQTTHETTTTKTYEIPVYKFTNTKDTNGNITKKPLLNAKFTLTKESEQTAIKLVKVSNADDSNPYDVYRVAMNSDTTGVINNGEITTPSTGKFKIQGLDADTYYLRETKQPDGYNLLKESIKIKIDEDGAITYATKSATNLDPMSSGNIEVENKTGSILPSTGGMGTTLFYIFGAILVIGSGVVLITKKRMK